jgi:hypothetical protein
MIIFNFTLFLTFVALGWIATGTLYFINAMLIEKDTAKRIASAILGALMFAVLIVCMVL